MNRVVRGTLVVGGLALPVVGLVVGVLVTQNDANDSATRLPIAAAGYIVDPPPDVDASQIGFSPVTLEAGDELPALGGTGTAWQLSAHVDLQAASAIAEVLGLDGVLEESDVGWTAGSGADQLRVSRADGGPWSYPAATDVSVLRDSFNVVSQGGGVDQGEAEGTAREVAAAAGIDLDRARMTSTASGDVWVVRFDPEVDGLPTAGYATTVVVDADGEIESASGYLASLDEVGEFDLVDADDAIARIAQLGGVGPFPGAGFGPGVFPEGCRPVGDGGVVCVERGAARVVVDVAVAEPARPQPPTTTVVGGVPADAGGGAPGQVPPAGAEPGQPVPLPVPIEPPFPGPIGEPRDVTVTGAEQALVLAGGVNGSGVWLVPGYLLTTDGDGTYAVVAVADEFLAQGGPFAVPLPAVREVPPVRGFEVEVPDTTVPG